MKDVVCTIITKDYGHYALALHDSLLENGDNEFFCVFVSDGKLPSSIIEQFKSRQRVVLIYENDFDLVELAIQLKKKYKAINHDAYRWSMKPVFITYLLQNKFDRVIYVDSDVFFYDKFKFLFEKLDKYSILLSPHWRSSFPEKDLKNFKLNFLDGIYNGGFIGASKGGENALKYWSQLCLFNCEVNRNEGFYVDQRYLDLLPTRYDGVGHIIHKGCNVANWNQEDCKRIIQSNGGVLINNKYPIVFIHFTNSLFKGVYLNKTDETLLPYLEIYRNTLLNYSEIDIVENFLKKGIYVEARKESNTPEPIKKNPLRKTAWVVYKKIRQLKRKLF